MYNPDRYWEREDKMATFGYAGKILRIDLSSRSTTEISTLDYASFLGGRGIAAKIYWDEVSPEINAFDTDNRLIFATGPLAGLPVLGSSRWTVCGKSPAPSPEQFCYGNLGGRWGAELKFAGYDALVIQGKSEKPVYLFLHDDIAELKDASALWGKGSIETRGILKSELGNSARVVAIGPAGENMATMANLLADNDASGSGGLGAVMGSKNLKAIVVKGAQKGVRVAQPERLQELTTYFRELRRIPLFVSPNRCTINDDPLLNPRAIPGPKMKKDPCYGCLGRCPRRLYETQDGKSGKFVCDSAMFYQPWAEEYYGEWNDIPFYATKLCDNYGLDTVAINLMISWLHGCYKAGILTEGNAGIPLSKVGSLEFIETLVRKISLRDGFGDILAQGIDKAADMLGPSAKEQVRLAGYFSKPGYNILYGPRLYIITGLLYAMEPRTPIQQLHQVSNLLHKWLGWVQGIEGIDASTDAIRAIAKRFWGSEIAADFSTYEGKALAAKMIQDREYAKECLILCDWLFPIMDLESSQNHVGDPTLESKILSAVIGKEVDEEGLYRIGERVFNLQRAILVREGHQGRNFDNVPHHCYTTPLEWNYFTHECLLPGKGGEVISRKGAVVERGQFERMKDEYYQLRQWDVSTGLQTKAKLKELGLKDVSEDLAKRGLAV
jgi:aldehyde:ferredoxin oxidoreductase